MDVRAVAFEHGDAIALRRDQDREVSELYAGDPAVVHRGESEGIDPDSIIATFVAYDGTEPIGHIALRTLGEDLEIKRMYVVPEHRGSGVANQLLEALENAAMQCGAPRLILHTGNQQKAAIGFYQRHGYQPIPVYPPYEKVTYSVCFAKTLP